MKPLNFFKYWNNSLTCSKVEKIIFFAMFFFAILCVLAGIWAFVFVIIKHVSSHTLLIGLIPSAIITIGFSLEIYFLFIKDYCFYRKSFKK